MSETCLVRTGGSSGLSETTLVGQPRDAASPDAGLGGCSSTAEGTTSAYTCSIVENGRVWSDYCARRATMKRQENLGYLLRAGNCPRNVSWAAAGRRHTHPHL